MKELETLTFFFYQHCIYNIEVKSHNERIKNYSDIKTANSMTSTNISFMVQKLNERKREIIFWQHSYKIKL